MAGLPARPSAAASDGLPVPAARPWLVRRLFPLLATVGLVAIGMAVTTWWGPDLAGKSAWSLPGDLWGTLVAAERLTHLDVGGLYTAPTGLVSLPGAAVILVPVAAIIDAAGLSLQVPGAHNAHPGAWLLAGPYQMAVSAVVLAARGSGRGAAAGAARAAGHRNGHRAAAGARLSRPGRRPGCAAAGRRGRGELDRHRSRGDQPAQLARR